MKRHYPLDKIKLIIFDLDGTLVDSLQDITNAINHAVSTIGYKPISPETAKSLVGRGITKLIESILRPEDKTRLPEVLQNFLSYYSNHLTDNTKVYPGVKETLESLEGYTKAVLSNKREALSKRILDAFGLTRYFNYILGSDSVPEKKPSPSGILYLLKETGIRPDEAMIVGDSELDIEAGRAAGIITVAVGYGYRDPSLLKDADYFIADSLKGLEKLFKVPLPGSS